MRKLSAAVLAASTVAVLAVGCSSNKSSNVSAAGKTTTTAAPSAGSSGTSGDNSSNGSSSGGSGGSISTAQCVSYALGFSKIFTDAGMAMSGQVNTSEIDSEFASIGASIPDSLKSQYQTVSDGLKKFEQDLKGASISNPSSYTKAEGDVNTADFNAAKAKIQAYFDNHCKSS
jgi:hypothetical protein